jgi:DNA replication and repair protein RecF
MHLQKLSLLNFKNYEELNLSFNSRINVFVGKNGSGKTNVLDSIYYLSMTKSAFSTTEAHCIRNGESFFMIKGFFEKAERVNEVVASVQTASKKVIRENSIDYQKISDHIGKYPIVLIAPDDSDLIKEGSETRRKFFDSILSQIDKKYLEDLIQYNHALKQRNSLLKMFSDTGRTDDIALESYDRLLVKFGTYIYERRLSFIKEYHPVFQKYFNYIVRDAEQTSLTYVSGMNDMSFESGLRACRQKDLHLQRSNFGIHRDDFDFNLGQFELKRLGSQGQQKSFVIALKLAQYEIIEASKGFKPLLLLDDIFDKLDDLRISKLLELIKNNLGQLFLTDARPERTTQYLDLIGVSAAVFKVDNGKMVN